MRRADEDLFDRYEDGVFRCQVCARRCLLRRGQRGVCGVREAGEDGLVLRSDGAVVSRAIDPIEKKPLSRFLPGSLTYSVATPGCSMRCPWCQNHPLLNAELVHTVRPQSAVEVAQDARDSGCPSFSFTYSEPTVSLEYVRDCFQEARRLGLKTVLVTNGNLTERSRAYLLPVLDAANVDVKTYDPQAYRQLGADLDQVLETIRAWLDNGVHVEITTLVIPTYNDDAREFRAFAQRLSQRIGTEVVWHLSAFHPAYLATHLPPTPLETLRTLERIAKDCGFRHVVLGNVRGAR